MPDKQTRMYLPKDREGFALLGDTNFAGPGFATYATFKTRPQNTWDLAAKLHDLTYQLNNLSVFDRPTIDKWFERRKVDVLNGFSAVGNALDSVVDTIADGGRELLELGGLRSKTFGGPRNNSAGRQLFSYDQALPYTDEEKKTISRFYKADLIFNLMNEHKGGAPTLGTSFWNWASRQAFLDDPAYLIHEDDFRNPLREQPTWDLLNDPSLYLMVPYSELGGGAPTLTRLDTVRGVPMTVTEPDWNAAHPMDVNPGFHRWFEENYGPILARLRAL
jgi:hypothetical protein